jgi:dUTP pyrophosphatase
MQVKFKKLSHLALIPKYAKEGDAGLDLTATSIPTNTTFQVTYGTGLAVEIPQGYVGLLFPRSSVRNYELNLSNSVGVIDSGYRGEIQATFNKTNGLTSFQYKVGDKVCQLVILPYPSIEPIEADELSSTERGEQGFGSTGA